ncbi:AraC family transcriptional regulator [Flavobacterium sp.]|uniref:helix-turn-helix domain-containing protein n=1 Tax=Flavobacterium sp. TaxID=239 RepID=UPI002628D16B|nr:AraC family transcriptional regulator [Flavobacterium sp.]
MNPTLEALFVGPTLLLAFLILANLNQVNIQANRWFGAFILCLFLIQIGAPLEHLQLAPESSVISELVFLSNCIIAPVFYFSILYYVRPKRRWKATDNLHFLFPFLMLLLMILSHFVAVEPAKSEADKDLEHRALVIFSVVFCALIAFYCIKAMLLLNHYQKNLYLYASSVQHVDLKWLQLVGYCVLLLALVWVLDIIFELSEHFVYYDIFSSTITFVGVYFIAFHALKQKEVFPFQKKDQDAIDHLIIENSGNDNPKKKLVPEDKLEALKAALLQVMEQQKPFLEYDLSLIKLAALLETTPHLLSYTINNGFHENFYQFVNRYRIEEAQKLILDPNMNHLNLLGIGYEVGFNSKTAFFSTFKKITNQTPTAFKRQHQTE